MESSVLKVLKTRLIFLLLNDKRKKLASLHFLSKTYPVVKQKQVDHSSDI